MTTGGFKPEDDMLLVAGVAVIVLLGLLLWRIFIAEKKLRVSEEQFHSVFKHSAVGMVMVGKDGCFMAVNKAFCRMLDYDEKELVGMNFMQLTDPDDCARCLAEIQRLLEGENDPMHLEKRYRRKDGEIVWASVVGTVVRDDRARPLFLVGQIADITERRRSEEALRQSELKFRVLVEQSLVGVYIVQDGKFAYVNPRLAEMTSYTCEEVLQMKDVLEIVAAPDHALVREQVRLRMTGEIMEAHYHFQARCKDGALIHVEVHGVRTEYNGRPALLGTVLDITERKRAESALSELSARLLQLQDEERRRLARELHDTTAQELAALTMNISLLQRYEPGQNEKFQRLLGDSLALAEKATQEIRTLSYLLHPPELDAVGLAAAVREYAAGLARRSGLRVDVSLPPELERLPRETELVFFRVVQESLANVLRHSRSESAIIEFTRNENEITLEVRDQGRGLPAEKLSSANEPGGLGVGIAGMRERLRQLGGKLEIISGTGGTTVRAIAPLAEKPRAVAA